MTSPDDEQISLSVSELRDLASQLQQDTLGFDPATFRKATVTALSLASSPPTISIQLSGDTITTIPGVRLFKGYLPAVSDTCLVMKQGRDLLAFGTITASDPTPVPEDNQVEYARTTTQTIATTSLTKANFPTAIQTDTAIVTVASNTNFTLVQAGVYFVHTNIPWNSSDGTGSRWVVIGKASDTSVRYCTTNNANPGGGNCHLEATTTRRFAAGDVISVYVYQDTAAGNLNLSPSTATGPMTLEIRYLGP